MFTPSPALNKYASIEQALTPPDPVGAGAAKGIQAAKASLSMTPPRAPRTSPMGRGLGALMANMQTPRPGTGVAGNLHSMAQAMGPAVSAYQDAQDRDAVYELELWKMQHEQMRHAEERALDERKMAEAERHNKATEKYSNYEYRQLEEYKQLEKSLQAQHDDPGIQLIAKYEKTPSMLTYIEKDIAKATEKSDAAKETLDALDIMENVFDTSPDLWKKVDINLLEKYADDPDYISQLAVKWKVPPKDFVNMQRLAAASKVVLVSSLKGVSPKGQNIFLEKRMAQAIPSGRTIPQVAKETINQLRKSPAHAYEIGQKKTAYGAEGLWWRSPTERREMPDKIVNETSNAQNEDASYKRKVEEAADRIIADMMKRNQGASGAQ